MITLRQIEIYQKYNGDGDDFIRRGTETEKTIIDYPHWALIDSLVQDLILIKKGHASESFAEAFKSRLEESCDSKETIEALLKTEIQSR